MSITNSMLNSLAVILETDGWDSLKEAGAEITFLTIGDGEMEITMVNQDRVRKTFTITEKCD